MMRDSLQSQLASADPVSGEEDERLRYLVRRVVSDVQAEATAGSTVRAPWWKCRRTMLSLGLAGAVALTGAALVIPLTLPFNGLQIDPDALIPIIYTTDSGAEVSCRYGIYFGDPSSRSDSDKQLAAFVANHDWTGIGQRIYEDAIANPFLPGRDGILDTDTPQRRDEASLMGAINRVIEEEIPDDLRPNPLPEGPVQSGVSDCKGQLR